MKIDYKRLSKEKLEEMIKEFDLRIMRTYTFKKEKDKKMRSKLRREIARIKTELHQRKLIK